jgi:hypothetical protein
MFLRTNIHTLSSPYHFCFDSESNCYDHNYSF